MVAQLREPMQSMEPLIMPHMPPDDLFHAPGYRRGAEGAWEITQLGRDMEGEQQRILLAYALGYEKRRELAARHYRGERTVQAYLSGEISPWLTQPIRDRLKVWGISIQQGRKTRPVRVALERMAARAYDMLRRPQLYSESSRYEVANDLYLISGAWREAES